MSADEKTLATFKIDKNHWLDFQALATANETNATKLLREFITACIDGRIDLLAIQPIEQPPFNLDEQIERRISPLLQEVEALRADIEFLKAGIANQPKYPSQDELQQTLEPTPIHSYLHQKASNMPSRASVVKIMPTMDRGVCLHCGSSELVRKGKSASVDKNGFSGRRVKCKVCQKTSTLWEAVD